MANLSEEEQLKWALEQSLNRNVYKTSDQTKCDGGISRLSEGDQLKLALDLSINEFSNWEEEEEKNLTDGVFENGVYRVPSKSQNPQQY